MEVENKVIVGKIEALGNYKTVKEKVEYKNIAIIDEETGVVHQLRDVVVPGAINGYIEPGVSGKFLLKSFNANVHLILGFITEDGRKIHDMETIREEEKTVKMLRGAGHLTLGVSLIAAFLTWMGLFLSALVLFFLVPATISSYTQAHSLDKLFNVEEVQSFLEENGFSFD